MGADRTQQICIYMTLALFQYAIQVFGCSRKTNQLAFCEVSCIRFFYY